MTAPATLTLIIPASEWMTSNQRDHYRVHRQKVKLLRTRAQTLALQMLNDGRLPRYRVPVRIDVTSYYRAGRGLDDDQCQPSAKAARDGLVLAGVLVDDGRRYVRSTTYHASVRDPSLRQGQHALTLTITPALEGTDR